MKSIIESINLDLRLVSGMPQLNLFGWDSLSRWTTCVKLAQNKSNDQIINTINLFLLYEKKKRKSYMGKWESISFQVISNIILSFCAFSTWKMAFSKLDRASTSELLTCQKMTKSKGSWAHNHIYSFILPNLSLSWQASQTHLSWIKRIFTKRHK